MTSRGKQPIRYVAAIALILSLTGCTDVSDDTGSVSSTADSVVTSTSADEVATTTEAASPETRYVTALRTLSGAKGKSDEELLKIGNEICTHLDNGKTIEDMALAAQKIKEPLERELGAGQIAVAIPTLCPQHLPDLARFAEEQKAQKTS